MINRTLIFFALGSVAFLSACKGEENKTAEFFVNNPNERAATLSKCETTDGAQLESNCVNAAEAERAENRKTRSQSVQELFSSTD
ncbi:hypothetical protein SAMN04488118_11745 [Epibacterium ulvae]|uniref:EexN family lipoprotein n=1 Tax=Epibacterium ulvae TaxID=1156985 RepID=A0A1G5RJG4_9RHOB|nr:hypothetical protein SAMN04488118_11745 [Epibacterium ulvae]